MRFVQIFLKNILKYFWGFVTVFLCSLISIAMVEVRLERTLVERAADDSRAGLQTISHAVERMDTVCRMLYQNSKFDSLVRATDETSVMEMVNLTEMKQELSEIDLWADEFAYLFAVFPNNDLYLSSNQCSLDFEQYYGSFLEMEIDGEKQTDSNVLKQMLLDAYMQQQHFFALDRIRYQSELGETTLEDALLYVSYDNPNTRSTPEYLLCFVIERDWLNDQILSDDLEDKESGFYRVTDMKSGKTLVSYGDISQKDMPKRYYDFTEQIEALYWKVEIGMSIAEIKALVSFSREFLLIYMAIGLGIVFALTCYYGFKRYYGFRRAMLLFPEGVGDFIGKAYDEYDILRQRINKLLEDGEDDQKLIHNLKLQSQAIMLEHLIVNGVKSPKERLVCERYLGREPEFYCVAMVNMRTEDLLLQEELVMHMADFLTEQGIMLLTHVHTWGESELFLIEIDTAKDTSLSAIKDVFTRLAAETAEEYHISIHVGISAIGTGFDNLNRCYDQARQIINAQSIYESEFVVEVYDIFSNTLYENPVDMEFLSRLHTLLLCGQREDIYKAFQKIEGYYTRMPYQYEQQKEQIYYAIRNVYHLAALQFNCKDIFASAKFEKNMQCGEMIEQFLQSTDLLCDFVLSKRKSRNEELKENILEYLQQHFQNPDLTASMVCQDIGISEKYLFQFLKEQTGETFNALVLRLRIEQAKEYLMRTEYSNEQIAMMSGFASVNTFYRNFKKQVGVTPNVYKENGRSTG